MPMHWTYAEVDLARHLMQGDILRPTTAAQSRLETIAPEFCDRKCRAFIITTQSCDLVVRKGKCSAQHVNVAVVRALDEVLLFILNAVCESPAPGVYYRDTKADADMLVKRIFNQNEQALGLFYLHPDHQAGILEPCVALLRVTATFPSEDYEVLRDARCGALAPGFRDKLGWLVGNLYSRVATTDWHEQRDGGSKLNEMTSHLLRESHTEKAPRWVNRSWVEAAARAGVEIGALPPQDLAGALEAHAPPDPKQEAIGCVTEVIKRVIPGVCSEHLAKITSRLMQDPLLARALKRMKRE